MIVPTSLDDMARRYELYDLEGNRILPSEPALPRILDTPSSGQGCHGCDAYRPEPQVSGNLHVDPDTTLPTAAGPLELSWHYNASGQTNSPYGFGRTVSINQTIQASGGIVTVTRGNSATVSYLFDAVSSSYKPSTPGLLYSLVADTTNNVWREYNLNGGETDFAPLNTTGQICSMVNYRDSCSNTITITYASGLPQNIEDPASRLVTLSFSSGLISSVEDWGARVTTFMFDTHSASPDNLLTTVIGPTGCTSVFGYATFALDTSIASAGFGWLLSEITDPNGYTTQYKYDRFTRVINRQIAGFPPTTYLFQPGAMITIDPLDRVATQLTGANFAVTGTVDATGAVTTITRNANLQETSRQNMLGFISTTNYDGTGNISSRESPLGLITTYTRDVYNNVTSTETPDGAIVTNVWGYAGSSFDTTGAKRRLQAQINQMGEITSFAWTGQGLLQSETSPLGTIVTHNYDSNFNRVSTQDQLNNLWTNVYDLVGNVTATENPLGARFSTLYDAQNRSGVSSFYGFDSQQSTRILVSSAGLLSDNYSYRAFGDELAGGSGTVNAHRFVGGFGYYRDSSIRDYVGARSLRRDLGRWISRDPIPGSSVRPYAYVGNMPLLRIDPSGLVGCSQGIDCCDVSCDKGWWDKQKTAHCPAGWDQYVPEWEPVCNRLNDGVTRDDCLRLYEKIADLGEQCSNICLGITAEHGTQAFSAETCCCYGPGNTPWKPCKSKYCMSDLTIKDWATDPITACYVGCVIAHETVHRSQCASGNRIDECCGYYTTAMCMFDKFVSLCHGRGYSKLGNYTPWFDPALPLSAGGCIVVAGDCEDDPNFHLGI